MIEQCTKMRFMALAPNLYEPLWTPQNRFMENSSSAEITLSSLAPHACQYVPRNDLFMPSVALCPSSPRHYL
ncbi:hypothetical protein ACFX2C_009387 [Malus domestica]